MKREFEEIEQKYTFELAPFPDQNHRTSRKPVGQKSGFKGEEDSHGLCFFDEILRDKISMRRSTLTLSSCPHMTPIVANSANERSRPTYRVPKFGEYRGGAKFQRWKNDISTQGGD